MVNGEMVKKDRVAGGDFSALSPQPSALSFTGASIDSRTLLPGQLFVALKGQHTDGHKYVPEAFARGAVAALVSMDFESPDIGIEKRLIRVPDPLDALQSMAHDHRLRFKKIPVVAVTGSTGKTTTKDMIATVLSGSSFNVLKTEGNLNNHIGLPLTLLGMTKEHTATVVEMGMSAEGEIRELARIALPNVGVITNVGPVHLAEGLDSIDNVLRAKLELLDHLKGPLVANADSRPLADACRNLTIGPSGPLSPSRPSSPPRIITYAIDSGADLRATGLQAKGGGMSFLLEGVPFCLSVPGRFNVSNALAAVAVGRLLGITLEDAAKRLACYHGAPMRFEVIEMGEYTVIDDTYNANPMSVKAALAELFELAEMGKEKPRRIAVLGDMLELGVDSAGYHEEAGRLALEYGIDVLVAVGPLMREAAKAFGSGSVLFNDSKEAAENICDLIKPGDCILVKGSRGMSMETIVKRVRNAV